MFMSIIDTFKYVYETDLIATVFLIIGQHGPRQQFYNSIINQTSPHKTWTELPDHADRNNYTPRNVFAIALNQTEIRLYIPNID